MPFWNRPLWGWLPGFNIKYSFQDEANGTHIPPLRASFEFLYGIFGSIAGITVLSLYAKDVYETNSFNPLEQRKIFKQREIDKEKEIQELHQKIIEEEKKYDVLYKKIFGPSGFADTNFDTGIDFREKVSAYRKMGFKDEVFMEGNDFSEPTFEQLEELIKNYEGDN